MTALRQRIYRMTIGTLQVAAPARVAFEIERSVQPHPNKATVKLWNLSLAHQRQIEQAQDAQIAIEVGHESTGMGLQRRFAGHVFRAGGRGGSSAQPTVRSEIAALDVITHAEARDGGTEYQTARTARSYQPGVSASTILSDLTTDLGVGIGNLSEAIAAAGTRTFNEGYIASGQAARELTQLCATLGLRWSIQHGVLQFMRGGSPIQSTIVRLAPGSGLIGSPEPMTRGRVKARAILSSNIWPGRALMLDSARVTGRYTVRSMKDTGDSHANTWESELELEAAA